MERQDLVSAVGITKHMCTRVQWESLSTCALVSPDLNRLCKKNMHVYIVRINSQINNIFKALHLLLMCFVILLEKEVQFQVE